MTPGKAPKTGARKLYGCGQAAEPCAGRASRTKAGFATQIL